MPTNRNTSARRRPTTESTAAESTGVEIAAPDEASPTEAITTDPADLITGAEEGDAGGGSVDAEAVEVAASATWAEALPWLALQMGSRPTAAEIAVAVPVWAMLAQSPGTTALRLAADAEARGVAMDPAVVARVLARFGRAGIVAATEDGAVTRWSPISPGEIIALAQRDMAASTAPLSIGSGGVRAGAGLPAGGLREQVAAYLSANDGQDLSPTEISRGIGGRSTGAISNACDRLVADRIAVRTCDRPRRYQHAQVTEPVPAKPTTHENTDTDAMRTER